MSVITSPALAFPSPPMVTLPIEGSHERFPVGRVFCIGRNYPWTPQDRDKPRTMPSWFMKPATAIFHAQGTLPYPTGTNDFCHEIELVVGIGCSGSKIPVSEVLRQYVWGYCAGLDLTRRDLQQEAKQQGGPWEPAKAFDHSAPCSAMVPSIVSGHPNQQAIWLKVNGIERQHAVISDLLYSVPELISMLSHSVMLQAGDLIFTGTPSGVQSLQTHDLIEAGVDGIGLMTLTVGDPGQATLPTS